MRGSALLFPPCWVVCLGSDANSICRHARVCQPDWLQQNASKYVPRLEMKPVVAADLRLIFNAPDRVEAESLLRRCVDKHAKTAPKLASWIEENVGEGLTVFSFPEAHRHLLRTTNGLERLNREIRRRTRVASIFPNEASCLRLTSVILMEISDDWQADKAYLTFADR